MSSHPLWTPGLDAKLREAGEGVGEFNRQTGSEGTQVRLLFCRVCKTIEELPDYKGPVEYDVLLETAVGEHERAHPHALESSGALFNFSEEEWKDRRKRKAIIEQTWAALGVTAGPLGFAPEFYASKNTFVEDANKCFVRHHRSIPCLDWKADNKRIGNPTKKGWQQGQVKVYLCEFCPVASKVMEAKRLASGGYD